MKRFTICIIYSAPPDRGIASQQMSGKKSNKFCITITLICNQTGTEKWPIFYIGKSKQPRYFKKKKPSEYGFWYQNNKTAWMTAKYFEEWIKELDQEFQNTKQHVALTLDNFVGHKITYEPTNIELIYFEPNLTPYVIWMKQGSWIFTRSIYWRLYWWWDRHGMQSLQRQLPIVGDMPVLQSKSTEPTRWSYLNWKLLQNPLRAHFRIKLNHHTWCSSFTCSRSGSMGHHWRVCIRNYWYISWGWRKIGGIFGYQLQILQLARGLRGDQFCRRQHCCCNQLDQDALIQSPQSYYPTLSIIQLPIHLSYPTAPSTPTRSPWKCDHGGNFSVAKKGTHSRHTPHIGGDIESNWRRFCGQNRIWVPRWQSVLAWNGCALSMCHLTLMLLAYRVRYENFELTSVTLTMSLMFKLPSNSFGPRLTQMRIFPCCK